MSNKPKSTKQKLFLILKWTLSLVVILFVARSAWKMWEKGTADGNTITLQWGWLFLAGVVYTIGWLPSVWFWRKMMHRLGGDVSFIDAMRAYYCGHLGKYVPGKAVVLVIRGSMVKKRGCRFRAAALTAAYETLIIMGAGIAIAVALAPWLLSPQLIDKFPIWLQQIVQLKLTQTMIDSQWGLPAVVAIGCLLISPLLSKLFSKVATKMAPHEENESDEKTDFAISSRLIGVGLLVFVIAWTFHGLSLGLVLKGVGAEKFEMTQLPIWVGAVSLATSVGFVVLFSPGGAGVREGILMAVLMHQPGIGNQQAVAAALLLRLVWLITELTIAAILYGYKKTPAEPVFSGS